MFFHQASFACQRGEVPWVTEIVFPLQAMPCSLLLPLLIPFSISFLSAFMLSGPRGRAEVEGAKGPRNLGSLPPSGARPLWPSLVTAEFGNTATQIVVVLCAVGSMSGQPQTCRSVNFHPDSHSFTIYRRLPSGNQAWKWCISCKCTSF